MIGNADTVAEAAGTFVIGARRPLGAWRLRADGFGPHARRVPRHEHRPPDRFRPHRLRSMACGPRRVPASRGGRKEVERRLKHGAGCRVPEWGDAPEREPAVENARLVEFTFSVCLRNLIQIIQGSAEARRSAREMFPLSHPLFLPMLGKSKVAYPIFQ